MIRIPSKILKTLLLAASKKDVRYYLVGVHVNERHVVGCDGVRLHAWAHRQEWPHGPVTIPRSAVELALKAKTAEIEISDVSVGPIAFKPVDGKYPDYMRVIPSVTLGVTHGPVEANVNPDYLVDARAFVQSIYPGEAAVLSLVGGSFTWQNPVAAAVVVALRPTQKTPVLTSLERFE